MILLGIETSCDETAAAVLVDGAVRSNIIYSQIAKHAPYGGVVPEIASRDHVKKLPGIMEEAVRGANVSFEQLDAIAVTYGPGLASSLLIGYSAARAESAAEHPSHRCASSRRPYLFSFPRRKSPRAR